MRLPFQPQVFASVHSQTQDAAAWAHVLGATGIPVQPLTAWLLLTTSKVGTKRTLSTEMSKQLAISHKTLESGLPKVHAKFERSMAHLTRFLLDSENALHPESAACRRRASARIEHKLTAQPGVLPCAFFHASIAPLGDALFEQLAIALDDLSTEILTEELTVAEVAPRIVRLAEQSGATHQDGVAVRPDLDPGFDATLLLLAHLDVVTASRLMVNDDEITSIFALLIDTSEPPRSQSARRRLLDLFYGLAVATRGSTLPEHLPSIRELEDTLMGGPHNAGTQSWMTRWRGGHKLLRLPDVEKMGAFVAQTARFQIEPLFRQLYLVALFFELVEQTNAPARRAASLRYREWWDAMTTPGREKIAAESLFFVGFRPHA